MVRVHLLAAAGLLAVLLAGEDAAAAGGATPEQEQACLDAAAQTFGVMESEVRATGSQSGADGQIKVFIDVRGDGATCTIGSDGSVADVSYGQ